MKRSSFLTLAATVLALGLGPSLAAAQVLEAPCLDPTVALHPEEARLPNTLPDNDDLSKLQPYSFAETMIRGAGFEDFGPSVVGQLCTAPNLKVAESVARQNGTQLWRRAVDRAQQRGPVKGALPFSDDRPLYWARMQVRAALRQWIPSFPLTDDERFALIDQFDRASRGMFDINFPAGAGVKRVIVSGFDPYTLDGFESSQTPRPTAPGAVGNNIRHGNPSGATALALDGTTYKTANGKVAFIEAYTLTVNYTEFKQGYLEDTVGPFMLPGPRRVDASLTVSQAGGTNFNLEEYNARYHGVSASNDLTRPCPNVPNPSPPPNTIAQLAIDNHECNSQVVARWGGPVEFDLRNPPQWTTATFPIDFMLAANTGEGVPPAINENTGAPVTFGVVWHTNYTMFPDCASPTRVSFPVTNNPTPPTAASCSYSGGGGNYLSNESAYRNTLLRDRMGLTIPAGHIHTPGMQHFTTHYLPSDHVFDSWRIAIREHVRNLVHAVMDYVE